MSSTIPKAASAIASIPALNNASLVTIIKLVNVSIRQLTKLLLVASSHFYQASTLWCGFMLSLPPVCNQQKAKKKWWLKSIVTFNKCKMAAPSLGQHQPTYLEKENLQQIARDVGSGFCVYPFFMHNNKYIKKTTKSIVSSVPSGIHDWSLSELKLKLLSSRRTKCPLKTPSCLTQRKHQSSILVNHTCLRGIHLWAGEDRYIFLSECYFAHFFCCPFWTLFLICLTSVLCPFDYEIL